MESPDKGKGIMKQQLSISGDIQNSDVTILMNQGEGAGKNLLIRLADQHLRDGGNWWTWLPLCRQAIAVAADRRNRKRMDAARELGIQRSYLSRLLPKMLVCLLFLLVALPAFAAEKTYHVTLTWEHANPEAVEGWKLYWSEIPGGPYEAVLDITNDSEPPFTANRDLYVEGEAGSTVQKYFTLTAYNEHGESDFSEEASCEFIIPVGKPFNLQITVIARSE